MSTYCEVLYLTKKTAQMFVGATASRNQTTTHSFSHFTCFSLIVTFMDLIARNQAAWKFSLLYVLGN